jgi:hypothetical protein
MLIGYGKLGRSMPLTLEKCGSLGGDVEMVAVVKQLAEAHPDDTFVLLGRNSGEDSRKLIAPNVVNPWYELGWSDRLRAGIKRIRAENPHEGGLTVEDELKIRQLFDEITLYTFTECDAHVWWVGQHGTSNYPIPRVDDRSKLTKPQDWSIYYAGYILRGINAWRDRDPWKNEEIWLNADPRNYHKMRDLKWPQRKPVLAQFDYQRHNKYERYGDAEGWEEWSAHEIIDGFISPDEIEQVWQANVKSVYSRLEINGLAPGTPFGRLIEDAGFRANLGLRERFGLFINEARAYVNESLTRKTALRDWVLPAKPYFIHGTWSKESQAELGVTIQPLPWNMYIPTLQSVRYTMTTPSSGSGWATTKPWEAFAAGTICFFHPKYDTQNHILKDATPSMKLWLRPRTPQEMREFMSHLDMNPEDRRRLVIEQRLHFENAMRDRLWMKMVSDRIWT